MIRCVYSILFTTVFLLSVSAQKTEAHDAIKGTWLTGKNEATVQIFETKGSYHAKIISLSQPLTKDGKIKTDHRNRNTALRKRPLIGILVFYNMKYNSTMRRWEGGKVYIPVLGKEADAVVQLINKTTLQIKGFIGNESLGQTQTWTRIEYKD